MIDIGLASHNHGNDPEVKSCCCNDIRGGDLAAY